MVTEEQVITKIFATGYLLEYQILKTSSKQKYKVRFTRKQDVGHHILVAQRKYI